MNEFTLPLALFLSAGAIALFSFIAVASWSDNRRREREAYYRSEVLKKLAEVQGECPAALAAMREAERIAQRQRHEGMKVGGLVTVAVGLGLIAFLSTVAHGEPAFMVGLIPLFIGAALLAYVFLLAPKDDAK